MEYTMEENKKQLQSRWEKQKEELELYEQEVKRVLREEEEEDEQISYSQKLLRQMQEECSAGDDKMQQLICEKQDMLSTYRRKKIEFDELFHKEVKQQRQQIEMEMEELHKQMRHLEYIENEETDEKKEGEEV